jgi:hypothetical protein
MRSSESWNVDPGSEHRHLFPWLETEADPAVRLAVLRWIARLGREPIGRGVQERPGVFAAQVPRTSVTVIWTLDFERRIVVLVHVRSWD